MRNRIHIAFVCLLSLIAFACIIGVFVPCYHLSIYQGRPVAFPDSGYYNKWNTVASCGTLVLTIDQQRREANNNGEWEWSIPGIYFGRKYESFLILSSYPLPGVMDTKLSIDLWLLAIVFGVYPTIFFVRRVQRDRLKQQALRPCLNCCYDLTGNKTGVCPECGSVITDPLAVMSDPSSE